jgi:glycerol-1-phosphate dehydrogenase [NAD(P)+]
LFVVIYQDYFLSCQLPLIIGKDKAINLKINIFKKHKFDCSCGKTHRMPIEEIVIKKNALFDLRTIKDRLNLGQNALMVTDDIIDRIIGPKITSHLEKGCFNINKSVFPAKNLIADEKAIVSILNDIKEDTNLLVATGSGTINDLTRYISFKTKIPYISIPTSPSMDGYTANVSLIINNGYKRTLKANCPIAIYADTDLLKKAPQASISAGYGDLIAKYTACADWLLSSIINNEYYCNFTHRTVLDYLEKAFDDLDSPNDKSIKTLVEGLMISGIVMHWVKSSRPAAGAEHHISHFWEMRDMRLKNPGHLHGLKVGLGTLIMDKMYNDLLNTDLFGYQKSKEYLDSGMLSEAKWKSNIKKVYGDSHQEILKENSMRSFDGEAWKEHREKIIKKSKEWKQKITKIMPESSKVERDLVRTGCITDPIELGLDGKTLMESIIYCKDLRSKYTILEALDYLGLLEPMAKKTTTDIIKLTRK